MLDVGIGESEEDLSGIRERRSQMVQGMRHGAQGKATSLTEDQVREGG